eukprot:1159305-Pelagomonas_calceolata.AAC.3
MAELTSRQGVPDPEVSMPVDEGESQYITAPAYRERERKSNSGIQEGNRANIAPALPMQKPFDPGLRKKGPSSGKMWDINARRIASI